MTTYADFISGLAAVEIAGVSRLTAPPLSVGALPCSFPALPQGEYAPVVFNSGEHWVSITVDFIVLIEAVGQSTLAANHAAAVAMMDSVHEALAAASLGRTNPSWTMQVVNYPVGDTNYWAVVATVQGRG